MGKWGISEFGPPSEPGVYCVAIFNSNTRTTQIVYVGSSKNIFKRVMNPGHHYRKLNNDISDFHINIYVKFKVCENYRELEKRLIKRLRPVYNINHK